MNTNSSYYLEISESEFHSKIGDNKKSKVVNFQNVDYKKGPTYSLSMRPQAITYCQNNMAQQLRSLIVQSAHFITVWSQTDILETPTSPKTATTSETHKPANSLQNQGSTPNIPTKKIIRRYRGQTYEVEIPDYAAINNNQNQPKTQRKKYRGQYID